MRRSPEVLQVMMPLPQNKTTECNDIFSDFESTLRCCPYAHSGAVALANFKRRHGTPKRARHEAVNSSLLQGLEFTKASFLQSELKTKNKKTANDHMVGQDETVLPQDNELWPLI